MKSTKKKSQTARTLQIKQKSAGQRPRRTTKPPTRYTDTAWVSLHRLPIDPCNGDSPIPESIQKSSDTNGHQRMNRAETRVPRPKPNKGVILEAPSRIRYSHTQDQRPPAILRQQPQKYSLRSASTSTNKEWPDPKSFCWRRKSPNWLSIPCLTRGESQGRLFVSCTLQTNGWLRREGVLLCV